MELIMSNSGDACVYASMIVWVQGISLSFPSVAFEKTTKMIDCFVKLK